MAPKQHIIEIRGCNFKNKGDVLMVESIISQMKEKRPDIKLVSRVLNTRGTLFDSSSLGKCISPRYSSNNSNYKKNLMAISSTNFMSEILYIFAGFVPFSKISGFIDVCGYSYGDPWGSATTNADFKFYSEVADQGKPYIFMPKSYGPFSDKATSEMVRSICKRSSLCFVRDRESRAYLEEIGVPHKSLYEFPD